ncbi:terpene synthase family protein [Nemania sp. FL0031]|nr:terpene synthase family protein [Nemania sp. FL0031]
MTSTLTCSISRSELNSSAKCLVQRVAGEYDELYGFGSMTCTIYDTAWLSLVTKVADGELKWLFPESFNYILETQSTSGGWDGHTCPSQIDSILSTAAALLSLIRHRQRPLGTCNVSPHELSSRITRATMNLQATLDTWDVSLCTHVGFEIIVPALLEYLNNEGISFSFRGKGALTQLNNLKLSKFDPEHLYGPDKLTALHCLEAFIGKIDFDRVAHHQVDGHFMASPSSTAAYLMHASQWDSHAETYLKQVIRLAGKGTGAVPSAFPSTNFEFSWLLSTLFLSGFTVEELECSDLWGNLYKILSKAFEEGGGTIGFAPNVVSDVDDTARGLLALATLRLSKIEDADIEPMIKQFQVDDHFRTYPFERGPSFTANCNALLAILHVRNPQRFSREIVKIVRFLSTHWWECDGDIRDKWNLCPLYPSMLLSEAFSKMLGLLDTGLSLEGLDDEDRERVGITLFEVCLRTMLQQNIDGSWDNSIEQTSYGMLILCQARKVHLFEPIRPQINDAINLASHFILSQNDGQKDLDYIWIEKVSYASPVLRETYRLAALRASLQTDSACISLSQPIIHCSRPVMDAQVKLICSTPMFDQVPQWQIRASWLEASLFVPMLRRRRLTIFPRDGLEEDKYFDLIPFFWTVCNNRRFAFLPTSLVFDLMIISFLNFQADEYIEAVLGRQFIEKFDELRTLIEALFAETPGSSHEDSLKGDRSTIMAPVSRFVAHSLNHPGVKAASPWDRARLTQELQTYLLAHVTQAEDNRRFSQQNTTDEYEGARDLYSHWVRTTSANHTSCPYAFTLLSCFLSSSKWGGAECFPTVTQKYFANDVCRHLATMCRMYNDYGSIARDAAERNVNSVNFPEFFTPTKRTTVEDRKERLILLAEYERACLDCALDKLTRDTEGGGGSGRAAAQVRRQVETWQVFCDVTDLHGQIYVVRDIASRLRVSKKDS